MTLTLGNRPRDRCRAGAEVVFGGCQPVDDGRTPCDCRSVNTIVRSEQARETGQKGRGHSLSMVQMVKQSQPFSCPFKAKRITRFAIVGKMIAEAPSPDLPIKNSHAITGSRRPGTLRKGRAIVMQDRA